MERVESGGREADGMSVWRIWRGLGSPRNSRLGSLRYKDSVEEGMGWLD